jgi:hypothetical protein
MKPLLERLSAHYASFKKTGTLWNIARTKKIAVQNKIGKCKKYWIVKLILYKKIHFVVNLKFW